MESDTSIDMADDPALAVATARAAGDAAWEAHATADALGHYRRALAAAQESGHADTGWLHLRCAQALERLGEFDDAASQLGQAREVAEQGGDLALEQELLFEASGLYASRDYAQARAFAEQAIERAQQMGDQRREGLALNRLGNILANLEQFGAGRALHEQALARFNAIGDALGIADSTDMLGSTDYMRGDVIGARHSLSRAAELFSALDVPERVASALTMAGLYQAVLDGPCATDVPPAAYRADAQRGLDLCRSIGWRGGEVFALVALACADIGDAHYDEAYDTLLQAQEIAQEIGHAQWLVIVQICLGLLFVDLLETPRALAHFSDGLAISEEHGFAQWTPRMQLWVAQCHLQQGEVAVAEAMLTPLLPDADAVPGSLRGWRALTLRAEIALATDDEATAQGALERLLAAAGDPSPAGLLLLHGHALAAAGREAEALEAYARAEQIATQVGPRGVVWRAAASRNRLQPVAGAARVVTDELTEIGEHLREEWRTLFAAAARARMWS